MKSFVRKSITIIIICIIALGIVGCGATPNTTNDSPQSPQANSAKANGEKPFVPKDINTSLNFYADYGEDVNFPQYRFVYSMKFNGRIRSDTQNCGRIIRQIIEHYTGLSGEDVMNKLNEDKKEDGSMLMWTERENIRVAILIEKDGTVKAAVFVS